MLLASHVRVQAGNAQLVVLQTTSCYELMSASKLAATDTSMIQVPICASLVKMDAQAAAKV
jgi:hypothetical protein